MSEDHSKSPPKSDSSEMAVESKFSSEERILTNEDAAMKMPPPTLKTTMMPPPPKLSMPPPHPKAVQAAAVTSDNDSVYTRPDWSGCPSAEKFPYSFEVVACNCNVFTFTMRRTNSAAQILKNGTIINTVSVGGKDLVMIGRNADTCDIALDHPSVSRHHIAVQFKEDGCAYVFDMSTHGTRLNKRQLKSRVYARLRVGDVLQVALA